ncbi:hypothetical protein [Caballeronia sp. NK8]
MPNHLYTEPMLRALDRALQQRRREGVILHSDQGVQYASIAFGDAAARPACSRRWVQPATLTTTRRASHSSARSKLS